MLGGVALPDAVYAAGNSVLGDTVAQSFLDRSVGEFLDLVAAREPAPGGGAAAAVTVATAAGLAAMTTRFSSSQLDDAAGMADDADRLRERASRLADEDARAYRAVLDAYALPKEPDRRANIRAALSGAAEVPLRIAELGAEVTVLSARLVADGNQNLRGDALTAAVLAEAAVRAAVVLARINVELGRLDDDAPGRELLARAGRCEKAAGEAMRQVTGAAADEH